MKEFNEEQKNFISKYNLDQVTVSPDNTGIVEGYLRFCKSVPLFFNPNILFQLAGGFKHFDKDYELTDTQLIKQIQGFHEESIVFADKRIQDYFSDENQSAREEISHQILVEGTKESYTMKDWKIARDISRAAEDYKSFASFTLAEGVKGSEHVSVDQLYETRQQTEYMLGIFESKQEDLLSVSSEVSFDSQEE